LIISMFKVRNKVTRHQRITHIAFSLACPVGAAEHTGEPSTLSIAAKRIDSIHYSRFDTKFTQFNSGGQRSLPRLPNLSSLPNEIFFASISSGLNVYPVKSLLHLFLWGELLGTARLFNRDEIFLSHSIGAKPVYPD